MLLRLRERFSCRGRASGWCSREKESTRCAKHTRRGEGRGELACIYFSGKQKGKQSVPSTLRFRKFPGKSGKQRVFGAPFWKLASFPESESWSGAKSEAKSRKTGNIPGLFPGIPGFFQVYPQNTRYFAELADFGPKPASDSAQSPENLMVSPGK